MYLSKKTYVKNWDHNPPEKQHQITVKLNKKKHPFINPKNISYITESLAYWRKANAIHQWFVDHCQNGNDDCREYDVERSQLQELYDTCVLVRDNCKLVDGKITNGYTIEKIGEEIVERPIKEDGKVIPEPSVAEDLLPTQSGFFFGGTEYDQYYMEDINNTIKMLKPELDLDYSDSGVYEPEYIYRASW